VGRDTTARRSVAKPMRQRSPGGETLGVETSQRPLSWTERAAAIGRVARETSWRSQEANNRLRMSLQVWALSRRR
jgi:hypothetical protein